MVLKQSYSLPTLSYDKTALLCIDMQNLCCVPGCPGGSFRDIAPDDWRSSDVAWYFDRLSRQTIPAASRLQAHFRAQGMEVIHLRIQSLTADGRDRSPQHKRIGSLAPPGSFEAQFLPEVAPGSDEIVINKTSSGAFNCTNIEYVLDCLGIDTLIVAGCETSECVETTVRDAGDRNFTVIVAEDATAALSPEAQNNAIFAMDYTYAYISSTDEVMSLPIVGQPPKKLEKS